MTRSNNSNRRAGIGRTRSAWTVFWDYIRSWLLWLFNPTPMPGQIWVVDGIGPCRVGRVAKRISSFMGPPDPDDSLILTAAARLGATGRWVVELQELTADSQGNEAVERTWYLSVYHLRCYAVVEDVEYDMDGRVHRRLVLSEEDRTKPIASKVPASSEEERLAAMRLRPHPTPPSRRFSDPEPPTEIGEEPEDDADDDDEALFAGSAEEDGDGAIGERVDVQQPPKPRETLADEDPEDMPTGSMPAPTLDDGDEEPERVLADRTLAEHRKRAGGPEPVVVATADAGSVEDEEAEDDAGEDTGPLLEPEDGASPDEEAALRALIGDLDDGGGTPEDLEELLRLGNGQAPDESKQADGEGDVVPMVEALDDDDLFAGEEAEESVPVDPTDAPEKVPQTAEA